MVPPGVMISSRTRTDGTRAAQMRGGRLERVDQLGRLLERQVLGPLDAEVAEQPVEVGVLPAGDRADRPDLVLRRRLARAGSPGRRTVGVAVAAGMAVRRVAGRRCRRVVRRRDRRLQAGQLVVDGLVGGDVDAADPGVEGVQVALEQAGVELQLEVARGAHRAVVRQADLAR